MKKNDPKRLMNKNHILFIGGCPPKQGVGSPHVLLEFCRDINYYVIALPSLVPILNSASLQLHMLSTENFLLTPIDNFSSVRT